MKKEIVAACAHEFLTKYGKENNENMLRICEGMEMIESSKVIDIRVTGASIKLKNALVIQLTHNIVKIEHAELKFQYM